jgi:ArsR family metal-binding transcriptional regulator
MVHAPCIADAQRIRIIAHLSGNLMEVFPYLNAEIHRGCYTPGGPSFTFSDGPRTVSLYPRSIAIGKAEDIVDVWRLLEEIRRLVNETWARRGAIEPCHETRHRPTVLEILKHLPQTNCRACGEQTCLAFATKLHAGQAEVLRCRPVFQGEHAHLKDTLLRIGMKLGLVPRSPGDAVQGADGFTRRER